MLTVWKYTDACAKQYRCDLAIYLMNFLSYLYGIIMDPAMNATGHENIFFDGLNAIKRVI